MRRGGIWFLLYYTRQVNITYVNMRSFCGSLLASRVWEIGCKSRCICIYSCRGLVFHVGWDHETDGGGNEGSRPVGEFELVCICVVASVLRVFLKRCTIGYVWSGPINSIVTRVKATQAPTHTVCMWFCSFDWQERVKDQGILINCSVHAYPILWGPLWIHICITVFFFFLVRK